MDQKQRLETEAIRDNGNSLRDFWSLVHKLLRKSTENLKSTAEVTQQLSPETLSAPSPSPQESNPHQVEQWNSPTPKGLLLGPENPEATYLHRAAFTLQEDREK